MHDSPGGSGRVILLVVLLLVTCYVADWTDEYTGYTVFAQYSAFQSANGHRSTVLGGSMASSAMLASIGLRSPMGVTQASAIETVFGKPMTSPGAAADDSSGRPSASVRDALTNSGIGVNSFSGSSMTRRSGSANYSGAASGSLGLGMSGSSSGLGSPGTSLSGFPQ
jgi:hypothetical protein